MNPKKTCHAIFKYEIFLQRTFFSGSVCKKIFEGRQDHQDLIHRQLWRHFGNHSVKRFVAYNNIISLKD